MGKKVKAECCRKFEEKPKVCKSCPLVAGLSKKKRRRWLEKRRRRQKAA